MLLDRMHFRVPFPGALMAASYGSFNPEAKSMSQVGIRPKHQGKRVDKKHVNTIQYSPAVDGKILHHLRCKKICK